MQQSEERSQLASEIKRDFDAQQNNRYNFETQWREIAQRFVPAHSDLFHSVGNLQSDGEKRTEYIFDSQPVIALSRFSSILDSMLTPRASTWHKLRVSDPNLNKSRRVKLFFDDLTRILFQYRYQPEANFAGQNNQVYHSIGAYGTGSMLVDEHESGIGMRYKAIHLSEFHLVENHQGVVDKVFRYFPLTIRQAYQWWGDRLPDNLISKLETSPETKVFFIHRVAPNKNIDPEKSDFRGMSYSSVYMSVEGMHIVSVSGYNTFPYPTARYSQSPGEVYGRSPAMEVLPAVKTLNEQKKTVLKQGHRTVDPVLLAHDDGVLDTFSLRPGAINYGGVTADGRPLVTQLPVGNVNIGRDMMQDERNTINDAFLVTVFQILTETPRMTATEVLERTREKGVLLSPTLGRIQTEYLGPLIERELDILSRQGLLPEIPPELEEANGEFKIEYDSPLSRAQRAEEASGLLRTVENAISIAGNTGNSSVLDHFDWDTIIPELSSINGVPTRWMKSMEDIQKERQARAQAAQEQREVNNLPAQSQMVNAIAKAGQAG